MAASRLLAVLVLALAGSAYSAYADDLCAKRGHTADENACSAKRAESAEKRLNAMYKKVLASFDPTEQDPLDRSDLRKTLIEAQRHWVAFRENDCAVQYGLFIWGTGRSAVHDDCMREHAEDRIRTLKGSLLEH